MAFGYRIFQFGLGRPYKPEERYDFDNVDLHSDLAYGLISSLLQDMSGSGDANQVRSTYFGIDAVRGGGWLFRIDATGGQYNRVRRVKDTKTNADLDSIKPGNAVVDDLPLLMIVPSYGRQGLIVAACEGRTHNAYPLQRGLEFRLKDRNLTLPIVSDIADATAWTEFLGQEDLEVTHVELIQTEVTSSRPTFGSSDSVSRARVRLTLADAQTKGNVLTRVREKVLGGQPLALTGVLGMSGLSDTDFDETRIVYVKDGREKSLSVATDYPHFIYPLDGTAAPTADELLSAAEANVEHLLTTMGIDFPANWHTGSGVSPL